MEMEKMASTKFEKNSFYWRLFAEYYALCQGYWQLEDTDEWWEEVTDKCEEFSAKYENCAFAIGLMGALIRKLEDDKRREA